MKLLIQSQLLGMWLSTLELELIYIIKESPQCIYSYFSRYATAGTTMRLPQRQSNCLEHIGESVKGTG